MCQDRPSHVRVSVIIVTYNNRTDIDPCLRSLATHSVDAEIIVVDNLSTDGTLDHVRRHYPHIITVSSGRNGGYGAGVNYGAKLAHGACLAVLNPDTEVQGPWLDPLIDALENDPRVGLATPTILLKGSADHVNACGNDVHLTGLAFCAGLNTIAPPVSAPIHPVAAVSGAAFVIRREIWDEVGGFDERFFMYLEDTDLSLRIRRLGYNIVHVPGSRVWHDYTVSVSASKLYHLERNRLLMLRKNLSPATLTILAPALLLTEVLTWAFCLRQGKAYVRAKWRSYQHFWPTRATRKMGVNIASSDFDHALLFALNSRLVLEQLTKGGAAITINLALTAFYALWRGIALTLTSR